MENRQEFPMQFISASTEYADFDRQVPAPYIRKKFALDRMPEEAELLITGLGFYRVFINGKEITKCALAPYISNPDDIIYYDAYDVLPWLETGGFLPPKRGAPTNRKTINRAATMRARETTSPAIWMGLTGRP